MTDRPLVVHVTTVPISLKVFFGGFPAFARERGFEVAVVSSPDPLLDAYARDERVEAHAIRIERAITPASDLVALTRLVGLFRDLRPRIVDAHTPKAGLLAMIAAWIARVPVRIYHVHGLPFTSRHGLGRALLRRVERISAAFATRVLFVSHSIEDVARGARLCDANKGAVLLQGTISGIDARETFRPPDARTRAAVRSELGLPEESFVVGFVGRIVRDKGVVELADAWSRLRDRDSRLRLVLVGPTEPQDPVPAEVLERLAADPRVSMLGLRFDLPRLYSAMDLVVLPSYREGFGMAALEGGAIGLPVVATRIPGLVDAVVDDVTGTLVPARDASELARAIEAYVEDPELRRRHGAAARTRALQGFARDAVWGALLDEYVRLAAAPRFAR